MAVKSQSVFRQLFFLCIMFLSGLANGKSGFAPVEQWQLEYQISGKGSPVIFLEAGGNSPLTDWDGIYDQLTQHTTVVRYSRVANGNSSQVKQHFMSSDYARHASQVLNHLNIHEPVLFVAHSYGGSVARDFAAAYPKRIAGLLMLDPSSEHDVDILRAIDLKQGNKEIAQIKLDDMKNQMSNQYLDFWSKRPLPDYPAIPDIPVTVIASIKPSKNPPNLFFTNKGRELWGKLWQDWTKAFPQGKAILTKKSGHYIQFDQPELVVSEVLSMWRKLKDDAIKTR